MMRWYKPTLSCRKSGLPSFHRLTDWSEKELLLSPKCYVLTA